MSAPPNAPPAPGPDHGAAYRVGLFYPLADGTLRRYATTDAAGDPYALAAALAEAAFPGYVVREESDLFPVADVAPAHTPGLDPVLDYWGEVSVTEPAKGVVRARFVWVARAVSAEVPHA